MPVNKGLSALSTGRSKAAWCSPSVLGAGIYVRDLSLRVKAFVAVRFRSGRDYVLQLTRRTKNEDQVKVPTQVTTGIPVSFVGERPGRVLHDTAPGSVAMPSAGTLAIHDNAMARKPPPHRLAEYLAEQRQRSSEPDRLWLDWKDLFALAVGRTVRMPGIAVKRGRP